ncbi:hypothetical protein QTN25_003935 [Entamoeba marina]
MKINPWKNPNDILFDARIIQKVFPNIQTFRIDPALLYKFGEYLPLNHYENIELVEETISIENYSFHDNLKTKCHIAFNGDVANNDTKTVYLYKYNIETLKYISQLKEVQRIYLNRESIPSIQEANLLNRYSNDYKITIFLSPSKWNDYFKRGIELCKTIVMATKVYGKLCVIPHHENIDFCINPFENVHNMMNFEALYLPTKFILKDVFVNYIDLTPFHYITEIVIIEHATSPKIYIKLPNSTQKLVVRKNSTRNDYAEIVNWKDLKQLQEIQDNHRFNIPYPQIKKKKFMTNHRTSFNIFQSLIELLCLIYLIMYTIFHIKSIISSNFDSNIIYQEAFKHIFYYSHLYILGIYLDLFYYRIKNFEQILFIIINLNTLLYPYSLFFYKSTFWIYLPTLFTYSLLISHFINFLKYSKMTHCDVNTYLNIILHGYWFKITTTKQIVNKIYPVCEKITSYNFFLFIFMNSIGLGISFIYSTGIISYIFFILSASFFGMLIFFGVIIYCIFF